MPAEEANPKTCQNWAADVFFFFKGVRVLKVSWHLGLLSIDVWPIMDYPRSYKLSVSQYVQDCPLGTPSWVQFLEEAVEA